MVSVRVHVFALQNLLREMAESKVKPNSWFFNEAIAAFGKDFLLEGHVYRMKILNESAAAGVGEWLT